jgi:hypothetical protein
MERPDAETGHRGADGSEIASDNCEYDESSRPDQAPSRARRRFIGRALLFIYSNDTEGAADLFRPLPAPLRYDLASSVLDKLAGHAAMRGDWSHWAIALHYLPHPGREAASLELRARLGARAATLTTAADATRRRLASYAARYAQAGIFGPGLVQRLPVENAKLSPPLRTDRLAGIARWAEGLSNAA